MSPAECGSCFVDYGVGVTVRLGVGRAWAQVVVQRRLLALPTQTRESPRDSAAALRRARLGERSGACELLPAVSPRDIPAAPMFRGSLRREERLSGRRTEGASGPAHRVVLHTPGGLRACVQVHGAGITVALPGRALHAAAARHRVVRVKDGFGRQRTRQDAEQQPRRQH